MNSHEVHILFFQNLGAPLSSHCTQRLIEDLDSDGNGEIDYVYVLRLTLKMSNLIADAEVLSLVVHN